MSDSSFDIDQDDHLRPDELDGVITQVTFEEGNLNAMYLRLLANEKLDNWLRDKLQDIYTDSSKANSFRLKDNLKVGDLCAAMWSADEAFYRARAEHFEDGSVIVRFVDFGNVDVVDLVDVYRLPGYLARIPFQAVNCKLRGAFDLASLKFDEETLLAILKKIQLNARFHKINGDQGKPEYEVDLTAIFNVADLVKTLATENAFPVTNKRSNIDEPTSARVEESFQKVKHWDIENGADHADEADQLSSSFNHLNLAGKTSSVRSCEVVTSSKSAVASEENPTPLPVLTNGKASCQCSDCGSVKDDKRKMATADDLEYAAIVTDAKDAKTFDFIWIPVMSSFSPELFYIYSYPESKEGDFKKLAELPEELTQYMTQKRASRPPNHEECRQKRIKSIPPGSLVAINLDDEDKLWYRGSLNCVTYEIDGTEMAEVLLIDYGETRFFRLDHVELLPEEFVQMLPKMALPCKIRNVRPKVCAGPFFDADVIEMIRHHLESADVLRCDDLQSFPLQITCDVTLSDGQKAFLEDLLIEENIANYIVEPAPFIPPHNELDPLMEDYMAHKKPAVLEEEAAVEVLQPITRAAFQQPQPCKFYLSHGSCRHGVDCRFLHAYPGEVVVNDPYIVVSDNTVPPPSVGSKVLVEVTVIRTPNSFHVVMPYGNVDFSQDVDPSQLLNNLEILTNQMNLAYGSSQPDFSLNPALGEIVAVRHDTVKNGSKDLWCRARITELLPKFLFNVFLVDYGASLPIALVNMRAIKKNFLRLPFQAFECRLNGISPIRQEWTLAACNAFADMIEKAKFVIAEIKDTQFSAVGLDLIAVNGEVEDVKVGDNVAQKLVELKHAAKPSSIENAM